MDEKRESPSSLISAKNGAVGVGLAYQSVIQIINAGGGSVTEEQAREREVQYLQRIRHDCGGLEWLESIRYQEEGTPGIGLASVYTALLTTTLEDHDKPERSETLNREKARQLSALEVLNREPRLVLTGAPGSGKSAFVNYLVVCLAGERLPKTQNNLAALTEALPDDKGAPGEAPQPWDHGPLVPVRVILRDFAASKFFPGDGTQGDADHVMAFIEHELKQKRCADYFRILEARLRAGEALVMFDGLDEVPQAGARRERMIQCIRGFRGSFGDTRVLVTCRPYAYEQDQWRIEEFNDAALADFGPGQIQRFIDRWYAGRSEFDADQQETRAKKLKQAVLTRKPLRELVARPLLLTLTAYLHANRHELPERRADLYERLLDLLIEKWEAARFKPEDAESARRRKQYSLAEFLQVGVDGIRLVLERVAFEAHALQDDLDRTADIPAEKLTHQLLCLPTEEEGSRRAVDALAISEYLRDRVGILYQRGGESEQDAIYTFPHRSFQEYLAAAYFRREKKHLFELFPEVPCFDWMGLAAYLGRTDPDRWREVVLLAGGIKATKEPGPVWQLLNALVPKSAPETPLSSEDAWGLRLASEILVDNLERKDLPPQAELVLTQIQQALPLALLTDQLKASERVQVGRNLAKIGDPRPGVTALDAMAFCYVPKGSFFLGTREDELARDDERKGAGDHLIDYPYWLAHYPVTVAQTRQYTEEKNGALGGADWQRGATNTPVVYVSWDEAMAFCAWLTKRWRGQGWLPAGYHVTLPSEVEWEKAARGGYEIPTLDEAITARIAEVAARHTAMTETPLTLSANPAAQRRYPWGGGEADEEKMNYHWNIGKVSAVGAYPGGASPYGCEELIGNVWEWTRSLYGSYPYPEDTAGRQQREGAGRGPRALRGGAFFNDRTSVRCAYRDDYDPSPRYDYIGFRVVLSPLL